MYDIKHRKSRQRIHSVFSETLEGANLQDADLRGADLRNVSLRFTDLGKAKLEGADFTGSNLDGANLAGATYDAETVWPAGFSPKRSGATNLSAPAEEETGSRPAIQQLTPGAMFQMGPKIESGSRFTDSTIRPSRMKRDSTTGRKREDQPTGEIKREREATPAPDLNFLFDEKKDYWGASGSEEKKEEAPAKPQPPEGAVKEARAATPPPPQAAPAAPPEPVAHQPGVWQRTPTPPPPTRAAERPAPLPYTPPPAAQPDRTLRVAVGGMVVGILAIVALLVAILIRTSGSGGSPAGDSNAAAAAPQSGASAAPLANRPPVVEAAAALPDPADPEGSIKVNVLAKDPDGEPVTNYYYWVEGQKDTASSASDAFSFPKPQGGEKKMFVVAEDGQQAQSQPFEISLVNATSAASETNAEAKPEEKAEAEPTPAPKSNRPPSLTASLAAEEIEAGKPAILVAAAVDPEGKGAKVEARVDGGEWVALSGGKIDLTGLEVGERKIEARAIDGAGLASALWSRTVTVRPAETPKPRFESYTETFNGMNLEMVWIPGGEFTMGSLPAEKGRDGDESPRHQVKISGFWLGKYEVTQKQHYDFIISWEKNKLARKPLKYKGSDKFPAQNLKWEEAYGFCQKLSEATGKSYTLPTEAQWEYACRAGTDSAYYTGDEITSNQANFDERSMFSRKGVYRGQPVDVGCFKANKFGLHDMSGNVWEWCFDWYADDYTLFAAGATNPKGPSGGRHHVLRGGGAHDGAKELRSANRRGGDGDIKFGSQGFRIARIP